MISSSSLMSAASTMVRPRLIYLSTSDVRDYADASSVEIPLRDQAFAQEGFKLVYGVRSFGFNASVTNISARQKNNQIDITVLVRPRVLEYNASTALFMASTLPAEVETRYTITIPDGNYTVETLFETLNYWIKKIVPSGWYEDRTEPTTFPKNIIGLPLVFSLESNSFEISYAAEGIFSWGAYDNGAATVEGSDCNDLVKEITLSPTEENVGLWEILFKNVSSTDSNKPVVLRPSDPRSGQNPPDYIRFVIDVTTYYDGQETELKNVAEDVKYDLIEEPNSNLLNTTLGNTIYPVDGMLSLSSIPYIAYHIPSVSPIYVDVLSNLDNLNMTTAGFSKNLLFRQFILGAVNGSNSFFTAWDTPIYNILDIPYISTIRLDFKSESNKWNFYNLEFNLEIIIFEVEDDVSNNEFEESSFSMPADDAFTNQLRAMNPSIQNPYPILGSGQRIGVSQFNDLNNRRVKRSRR